MPSKKIWLEHGVLQTHLQLGNHRAKYSNKKKKRYDIVMKSEPWPLP